MVALGTLRSRIRRILGDTDGTGYSDEILLDSISAALDAILPWVPKTGVVTITGDGSATSFDLPIDLYSIEAVVVQSSGEVIQPAILAPGKYRGTGISGTNDWIEFPYGHILFSRVLDGGEIYELYYLAHWTKPDDTWGEEDTLEVPEHVVTGLVLYGGSYALLPSAVSIGEVRQFATKVDSGTPEHNPMQRAADYLLKLFTAEMSRHPKYQKSQR